MTETQACPRCGTENRPGISFCATCGQRLVAADDATLARPGSGSDEAPCPRCGAMNRSGSAFCSECGFNIRPAVAAPGVAMTAEAAPGPAAGARPVAHARAWLGPLVLGIAAAGMLTAWLLPFSMGGGSLADQALAADGFGLAFWTAYPADAGLLETAYFGVAAPLPILVGLLAVLAVVGIFRAVPGRVQRVALVVAIAWCLAFSILFVVVEVGSGLGDSLIGLLRCLSPAGLIASTINGICRPVFSVTT